MMLVGQVITIPFAYLFQFKVAYIFTYIAGLFYGSRYKTGKNNEEKKKIDRIIYLIAAVGWIIRIFLARYPVHYEAVGDLLTQWIKLVQGSGIFIIIINTIPQVCWKKKHIILTYIAGLTYEVYLTHQFFADELFVMILPFQWKGLVLMTVLGMTFIASMLLKNVEERIAVKETTYKNI